MKPGIFLILVLGLVLATPPTLSASKRFTTIDELKQEIVNILKNRNLNFLEERMEQVSVDFLINARNEIVVLDIYGDSIRACEYVKEMLNYKRVKYKQTRQLTRYMISIRLVKNAS